MLYNVTSYLVAILVVIIGGFVAYFKWQMTYWKRKNVKYYEPSFPMGSMPKLSELSSKHSGEKNEELYHRARNDGHKAIGIWLLHEPGVLIADVELAKTILTKEFNNFPNRGKNLMKIVEWVIYFLISYRIVL